MTDALIPIAIVAVAALLVWKRWTRATYTQRVDLGDLGGGLAGIVGSAAMLVLAWATTPAGRVPWAFVGAAVAMALGARVAFLSLQLTEYLPREDGLYYRPDLRIGIPVFVALIAVLAIKALHVLRALEAAGQTQGRDLVTAALTAVDPISPTVLAFTASSSASTSSGSSVVAGGRRWPSDTGHHASPGPERRIRPSPPSSR